jgi:cysteine desulfurase
MGVSNDMAQTSLRFGLGRFNTEAEVDEVIERVAVAVARLREISPLYERAKGGQGTTTTQRTSRPGGLEA